MDRRRLLTLGIGAIGGAGISAGCDRRPPPPPPAPAGPVEAKIADSAHHTSPSVAAERYFAEQVTALTADRYRIDVAAGGVLGDDSRVNEMVRTGRIAFAKTLVNELAAYDKRLGVLALPYVFADENECVGALTGELGRRCAAILGEAGLIVLAYFYAGERGLYNAERPIRTPADVKGLRLRVPPSIVSIDLVNAMGGRAVPMVDNEVLSALQERVVDGAEGSPVFYLAEGHAVQAPYFARTGHQHGIDVLIASRKWLSGQPADVQAAIREAGRRTQAEAIRFWRQAAARVPEQAADEGARFTDVDVAAFRRVVAPVVAEHRGTFGDLGSLLPAD